MAWVEVLQWNPLGALTEAARRLHETIVPEAPPVPVRAAVPACRCSGRCRCGTLVPYLLQLELERDCEFYRDVH